MPTYDRKTIEADAEDARARGEGGGKYLTLKDGDRVEGRFLPVERVTEDQNSELYLKYAHHYIGKVYYICLNQPIVSDYVPAEWGKDPCRYCGKYKALKDSRDPDEQELAREYKPSSRYASNFKVAKGQMASPSGDVMIFRYSVQTQPGLVELAFGPTYGDVLELEDGRDVTIIRRGADWNNTKYTFEPKPKTYTIPDGVLDGLHDLYADLKMLSPQKQAEALKGKSIADADYVTLRELKDAKDGVKPKGGGVGAKPSADRATARAVSAKEMKTLSAFLAELDDTAEFDDDKTYAEVVASLVTEAVGTKTKGLSDDFKAWLEANGCDVQGRVVAKAAPKGKDAAEDAGGEMSEVEQQIAEVRKRRALRK